MVDALTEGIPGDDKAPSALFKARYRLDPVGFARDCLVWPKGESLTEYQESSLRALVEHGRECLRAPHGVGKSAEFAIALLWFALTRDGGDWKIITTASSWTQLVAYLWPEVHKWARRIRWDIAGRAPFRVDRDIGGRFLKLDTGAATSVASKNHVQAEGAHADSVFYIFDEAKGIPDAMFNAAEGALGGKGEAFALAGSTPGEPAGMFHAIQTRAPGTELWHVTHVTKDQAIAAGRMSPVWADKMAKLWGVNSALYRNRVLGEFAAGGTEGIIPLAWLEAAMDRWRELELSGALERLAGGNLTAVAQDVSDGGQDRSIMAQRSGMVLTRYVDNTQPDAGMTMALAGTVRAIARGRKARAIVDGDGVGAGVASRLAEPDDTGFTPELITFRAGVKAVDRMGRPLTDSTGTYRFGNWRSFAWWRFRELLNPENGHDVAICASREMTADGEARICDRVVGDLTAVRWRVDSEGVVWAEPKMPSTSWAGEVPGDAHRGVKGRLGRSPDYGDATVMVFEGDDELPDTTDLYATDYLDADTHGTILGSGGTF